MQTKALIESKLGKVVYKVQSPDILDMDRYKEIVKVFETLETKLNKPLVFNVHLDYMTMDALRSIDVEALSNIIGTKLFYLINDIVIRKNLYDSKVISDSYLSISRFKQLKEYYTDNEDFVLECFTKGYSSLPLFEVLYQNKKSSILLDEIYSTLRSKQTNLLKRKLACNLVVDLENELFFTRSDKTKEDIYYKVGKINKYLNELDDNDIMSLSNITIDNVYFLIESKFINAM